MGTRILIADDSLTIQKVVELTFSREDFVLIPARSGEEAIRKAKEAHPDLMLIDLVMPDKNGYEVCRALREDPLLKATPIILLTGTFEAFDKDEGLRVGANDFVTKPFESQTLISKVKQLLSPQAAPVAAEPALPLAAAPAGVAEDTRPRPAAPAPPAPAPAVAAALAPAFVAPPAPAPAPVPEPAFELREEPFPELPPTPPAPHVEGPAPPELQELSLDDLTAEEPLAGVDVSPLDLEQVESGAGAPAAPAREVPPEPAAPAFELELGSAYPETGPSVAEAPPAAAAPAMAELDLDLLAATPAAAPMYDLEPMDLEAAPAPAAPPPPGTEDLLRELESAAAPAAPPPAELAAAPAGIEAPSAVAPEVLDVAMPRLPEPVAARLETRPAAPPPAPAADAQAARLAAELAPYLAREIADRIVERIERVVWEVVPDLAEALIARELDRIKERAERRPPR